MTPAFSVGTVSPSLHAGWRAFWSLLSPLQTNDFPALCKTNAHGRPVSGKDLHPRLCTRAPSRPASPRLRTVQESVGDASLCCGQCGLHTIQDLGTLPRAVPQGARGPEQGQEWESGIRTKPLLTPHALGATAATTPPRLSFPTVKRGLWEDKLVLTSLTVNVVPARCGPGSSPQPLRKGPASPGPCCAAQQRFLPILDSSM